MLPTSSASASAGSARPGGLAIEAPRIPGQERVLTPEALDFTAGLVRRFGPRRAELLALRARRQAELDRGVLYDFLPDTRSVREGSWRSAPLPADLIERRVEITGGADRPSIAQGLSSGADVFVADLEGATAPTWENVISGQVNLADAVRLLVAARTGARGAPVRLPTLMVRPRGFPLTEAHLRHRGRSVPAGLVDFGLYLFHNARALTRVGTGPYLYLSKLESHLEARWWHEVFLHAEERLGLPRGTIRATVPIETLPAAFEMDEILHELGEHAAGLSCTRWEYMFSFIKKLRAHPDRILPDRAQMTMAQPCMRAYTQLLVQTCHRRGVHAIGCVAAQAPVEGDAERQEKAIAEFRSDRLREVREGLDGTRVAHPALVGVARAVFDSHLEGPHQIGNLREDVYVVAADLLAPPRGTCTMTGLRSNVRLGIQYLESWLSGHGRLALQGFVADAAAAEISRGQVWQWLEHGAVLEDGQPLSEDTLQTVVWEEMESLRRALGGERFRARRFRAARLLFERMSTGQPLDELLGPSAYELLMAPRSRG